MNQMHIKCEKEMN